MIQIEQLPRSGDGIVLGAWRVVHRDPSFNGQLAHLEFRDGLATMPAFGLRLVRLVAGCGHEIFLEQWTGPYPTDFTLPDGFVHEVPESVLATLELAPWRQKVAEAMDPLTRELIAYAEALGDDPQRTVDRIAELVRAIPTFSVDVARDMRDEIEAVRAKLSETYFSEFPKLLAGCIEQLDGIIAAAKPSEPQADAASTAPSAPIDAMETSALPPAPDAPATPSSVTPPTDGPKTEETPADGAETTPPSTDAAPSTASTAPTPTDTPAPKSGLPPRRRKS